MALSLALPDALRATIDFLLTRTGQVLALVMAAGLAFAVLGTVLPRWVRPMLLAGATVLAACALTEPTALPAFLLSLPAE